MNSNLIAILAAITSMLSFGFCVFFIKLIKATHPAKIIFWAYLFGLAPLIIALIIKPDNFILTSSILFSILLIAAFRFIGEMFLTKAIELGKLSIIVPISGSFSIVSAITSTLFFGQKFKNIQFFIIAFVILGIFLISRKNNDSKKDKTKGLTQVFIALIFIGIRFSFWDKFLETNSQNWIFEIFLFQLFSTIYALVYSLINRININLDLNKNIKNSTFILAVGLTGSVGHSMEVLSLKFGTYTATTSLIQSCSILVSTLLGLFILKEKVNKIQTIGIGILFLGIILSSLS